MTLIVVDTSALVAVLADEPAAPHIRTMLAAYPERLIAAPVLTEFLLVSRRLWRESGPGHAERLIRVIEAQVVPTDEQLGRAAARAMARWGKGVHPAALDFGDSFSYALAESLGAPLLFVGNDFAQTDVLMPDPARDGLV